MTRPASVRPAPDPGIRGRLAADPMGHLDLLERVRDIAPDEPQSWRDLGLALAAAKDAPDVQKSKPTNASPGAQPVARVTGASGCVWPEGTPPLEFGDPLVSGRRHRAPGSRRQSPPLARA